MHNPIIVIVPASPHHALWGLDVTSPHKLFALLGRLRVLSGVSIVWAPQWQTLLNRSTWPNGMGWYAYPIAWGPGTTWNDYSSKWTLWGNGEKPQHVKSPVAPRQLLSGASSRVCTMLRNVDANRWTCTLCMSPSCFNAPRLLSQCRDESDLNRRVFVTLGAKFSFLG